MSSGPTAAVMTAICFWCGLHHRRRRDVRGDRLGCAMTDPLERIRYDDPDAPSLFPTPVDAADRAYEQFRDETNRGLRMMTGIARTAVLFGTPLWGCDVFAGAAD